MRLLWIFIGLAILVLVPFALWGEGFERVFSQAGAIAWLGQYGQWAWAVGIGLLVLDLALPVPATAVMAALGYIYGPIAGGLIAAAGSFLSGALGYGLCRGFGRPAAARILGASDLERSEQRFLQVGAWLVVLSRWLPVFPEVIACMAGLLRMPARIFFSALACGSLPLGFAFAAIGHAGVERPGLAIGLSAVVPPILWLIVPPWLRGKQRAGVG